MTTALFVIAYLIVGYVFTIFFHKVVLDGEGWIDSPFKVNHAIVINLVWPLMLIILFVAWVGTLSEKFAKWSSNRGGFHPLRTFYRLDK